MKSAFYALALGSLLCTAAPASLVITGSTLDCFGRHTPGVDVFVFAESPQLRTSIDGVLKADDNTILDRFSKLIGFVKASNAIAHTKSDRNGSFRAEAPTSEKLIVIGYMEMEDDPLYWMYSYVNATHQTNMSLTLDECKEH